MKGRISLKSGTGRGSNRKPLAALAIALVALGAIGTANSWCCPPAPSHDGCRDGDEPAPPVGSHPTAGESTASHDPCPDLICPAQGFAVETAVLNAPLPGPAAPFGAVETEGASTHGRPVLVASAVTPCRNGPLVPPPLQPVLRL